MRLDRRPLLTLLITAGALASPAGAAAATERASKLVTIIGTPTVVVDVADPSAEQRIPIRLARRVDARRLVVQPLLARQGRNRNASLLARFGARLDPKLAPAALAIHVNKDGDNGKSSDLAPGTYRLILGFREGRRRQRIALDVIVPPVTVKAVPSFDDITTTVGLTPIGVGLVPTHSSPSPRLVLDRASTTLTNIDISVQRQPRDGEITFKTGSGAARDLAPGGVLKLEPALKDVSPGTYTGTVEVRADQLSKPLTFPYKIVVQRSGWYIILLVAAGFLAGLIVRKGLVALLGWLQAVRAAHDYAAELDAAITVAADAAYRERLAQARNVLLRALGPFKRRTTITAAVARATEAWAAANAEYSASYTAGTTALARLGERLPAPTHIAIVDDEITRIAEHAATAAAMLSASDPTGAMQEIETATTLLDSALPDRIDRWAGQARELLDAVVNLPAALRAGLDASVATASNAVAAIDTEGATTAQRLTAANAALVPMQQVVRKTLSKARSVTHQALTLIASSSLEPAGRPDPAQLRTALQQAEAVHADGGVGRADTLPALAAALDGLSSELATQALGWSPLEADVAQRLVREGQIVTALTAHEYAELGNPEAEAAPAEDGDVPPGDRPAVDAVPSPDGGAAPPVPAVWVSIGSGLNLAVLAVVHTVRILVLTVLFATIGWLAYHEHFAGTTQEMLGIFLWAFATDLTIEGVTQMAKPYRAAPKTANPA